MSKKPVVYDPHCPKDYEHDYLNVHLVGDKSKATHVATCLIVGPNSQHLRIDTMPLPSPPQDYALPLRAEPERMEVKWTGEPPRSAPIGEHMSATAWKGVEAKKLAQKLAQKRPILPETFPDLPGVPKPMYDFTALNEEYHRVKLAMRYAAEQRRDGDQVYAPPRMSAADRAVASAEWSRQLREKVDAAKKRDAEKARETHYWDPEGGEW